LLCPSPLSDGRTGLCQFSILPDAGNRSKNADRHLDAAVCCRKFPLSALIFLLPKDFRLFIRGNTSFDPLKADFKKVIDCELDRMTDP
jgi:hypothetical protein